MSDDFQRGVREAMKRLRKDSGMSLRALGPVVDLDFASLSKRERGDIPFRIDEIGRILDALDGSAWLSVRRRDGWSGASYDGVSVDDERADERARGLLRDLRAVVLEMDDAGRARLEYAVRLTYETWRAEQQAAGKEHDPLDVLLSEAG